jgi:serine/threonine protein phosphatase PrpC/CRP-like cAMP-binding protein
MGGHAAGEVASALAVRIIHEEIKAHREVIEAFDAAGSDERAGSKEILNVLEQAVQRACAKIHEEAKADPAKRGMGTTLSALLIAGSQGFIAHVGDSRIYLLRGGKIQQVTEDHTVYNELVKRGKLSRDQIEKVAQKNAITRAVGVYERVEVDTISIEVLPGDQFLLASDGLHGYIAHTAELEPYLEEADGETAAEELIALANRKGGKDNITAVLVRLGEGGDEDSVRAKRLALKRDVLVKMPLFSRLNERELLRIMQVAEVRAFGPGDEIVREGDRGDELFIVLTGLVQVTRGDTVLLEVGTGEHFGEMALIRAMPRSATVTAVESSELITLHRADFFEVLRKEHELAVKLLWQFLGVLADRLDQTSRDLSNAKTELLAEDISEEIFPDPEEEAAARASAPPA